MMPTPQRSVAPTARVSGVLLHPTSLPGSYGIGGLGPAADRFIDFLAQAGQRRWQVLPLGPTGYGDSPYATFSSMAGNPLLICPEQLVLDGHLPEAALATYRCPEIPGVTAPVDYATVTVQRAQLIQQLADLLHHRPPNGYDAFVQAQAGWLDDYALFMALKTHHQGAPWYQWPEPLNRRDPAAIAKASAELARPIEAHKLGQFLFFEQWQRLHDRATQAGVQLIGDLPIYVPRDSVEVWTRGELFQLDRDRQPTYVAGVPPDYFSATGQLWGNPLYRWSTHQQEGYRWWTDRIESQLAQVDILRLDHFRGFAAGWAVPASSVVATDGTWQTGPGLALFTALADRHGHALPLIAEDLGLITDDVIALRKATGLPGMAVLQFAFDGTADNPHLPANHQQRQVVYTGTHDNDTSQGWFQHCTPEEQLRVLAATGGPASDIHWNMAALALESVADTVIIPMQDLLGLASNARMNCPGEAQGNWCWRANAEDFSEPLASRLKALCNKAHRTIDGPESALRETGKVDSRF